MTPCVWALKRRGMKRKVCSCSRFGGVVVAKQQQHGWVLVVIGFHLVKCGLTLCKCFCVWCSRVGLSRLVRRRMRVERGCGRMRRGRK